MKKYSRRKPLFSLHIPKCGGTSLTEVLRSWYYPCFHAHYIAHDQGGRLPSKPMLLKRILHTSGVKPLIIHGHFEDEAGVFDYYKNAMQFITVIRDPLEMQLSLYWDHQRRIKEFGGLYWKGEAVEMEYGGDINRWVSERPSYLLDFFPFELTEQNFKSVLSEKFVHIGVVEKIQQSVDILANKLGKPTVKMPLLNESERLNSPSKEAIAEFQRKHQLEYSIHQWAMGLNS